MAHTPVTPHLRSRLSHQASHSPASSSPAAQSQHPGRIVKKLVLRGNAFGQGSRYELFLLVTVPATAHAASYPLLPDTDVKLLSSSVDALSSTGGYAPLSETAARAARHLGGRVSVDSFDTGSQPRITISNYAVTFSTMPKHAASTPSTSTSPPPAHTLSYMVCIQLETRFKTQPPRSPYALILPVPRCLHSRIHFTFSPEVVDSEDEVDVRIEPPLGKKRPPPKPRRSFGGEGSDSLDPSADDDARSMITQSSDEHAEEGEEENLCVKGLFQSTDQVSIRWAGASAGKLQRDDSLAAIRCDTMQLQTTSRYTLDQDGRVRLDVLSEGVLRGVYCSGLDRIAYLPLVLDSHGQAIEYQDMTIEDTIGLRSWHFLNPGDVPGKHPERSGSNSTLASLASSSSSIDDTSLLEGDDLLATRPPRGFDASLDLSAELSRNNGNGSKALPPLGPDEKSRVILYLDVPDTGETFSFTLRYRLLMDMQNDDPVVLPTIKAPTAAELSTSHHLEPHAQSPPSGVGFLRPARSKQVPDAVQPDTLTVEHESGSASPMASPYLHLFPLPSDEGPFDSLDGEQNADSTLQAGEDPPAASSPPHTPQAVFRPMPIWDDSMVLHDDETSRPSVIAEASLSLWMCSRDDGVAGQNKGAPARPAGLRRMVCDLRCSWPLVKKDGRPLEEMDLWLPRTATMPCAFDGAAANDEPDGENSFGRRSREPTVLLALVAGTVVEPHRSDAAENVCLHLRRPPQVDDKFSTAAEVRLIFEYESLDGSSMPVNTALSTLPLPLPLFASEVLLLHVKAEHDGVAVGNLVAPSFDIEAMPKQPQAAISTSHAAMELHRFVIPPLTPLDITALLVSPQEATRRSKRRRRKMMQLRGGSPQRGRRRRWLTFAAGGGDDDEDEEESSSGERARSSLWMPVYMMAALFALFAIGAALSEELQSIPGSHIVARARGGADGQARRRPSWTDLEMLGRRVEQLAMAANVDFGEGTWNAEQPGSQDREGASGPTIPPWPRPAARENFEDDKDDESDLLRKHASHPTTSISHRHQQPSLVTVAGVVLRVLCSPIIAVGRGAALLLGLVARGGGGGAR
ncbi:hypothetical protein BDZ90DRAFT_157517 [Jaminaea rosea]|uniref:Uncharacterized protein n=1 Tax=Jaminaea rosea TaxID=1569628 RepID=A0A316URN0_9BASI|nr:hypothetical protein BDZ90DRAFT_157517 [Jaminaea rosea]PWN27937.1 hypothetical protein BDZ90DRAFT_157517 [Jaminaea rosea]